MVCARLTMGPEICFCSRAASQYDIKTAAAIAAALIKAKARQSG